MGLVLMGGAMLSKFLIQFSVDRRGCVPSLLFDLGPNYGEANGELQYSCLENSMDGVAWWATVHGVAKSWTRLSKFTSLPSKCSMYALLHSGPPTL